MSFLNYTYRLYPTKKECIKINQIITLYKKICDRCFKYGILYFEKYKDYPSFKILYDLCNMKCSKEYDVIVKNSEIIKAAIYDVLKKYDSLKKGKTNDKHQEWQNREYFTFIAPYYEEILRFEKNRLIYSNVLDSKVKIYRNINGVINKMTIIKQGDKYYLIVLVRKNDIKPSETIKKIIGIDVGVHHFLTMSNSNIIDKDLEYKKDELRLKRLRRVMIKKIKGGSNWKKIVNKIGKLERKIRKRREDFLHKISKKLIEKYDLICTENLKVEKFIRRGKSYGKIWSDISFYKLTKMFEYKAKLYGKKYIKVSQFFPSSQLCSNCGFRNYELKNLSIRNWKCPVCLKEHDRDINAAKNIANQGLKILKV